MKNLTTVLKQLKLSLSMMFIVVSPSKISVLFIYSKSLSIDSCEHTTWKNFTSRIQMIRDVDTLCLRTLCSVWKSNLFKLFQVFIILQKRIKWRLLNNVKHKLYLLIKLLFLIVHYFEEWTQMIIHFFSKGNSCSMNVRTLLVQKVPLLLYILP